MRGAGEARPAPGRAGAIDVTRRAVSRLFRSTRAREAALVGSVLAPLAADAGLRRAFLDLDPPRQAAVALMVASTLAGQFILGDQSFPFVDWEMYAFSIAGDPVVVEFDARLRSGRSVPLSPSRFLGTQSAGRLMEALRRQVVQLQTVEPDTSASRSMRHQHESALQAIVRRFDRERPDDPVEAVLVSERTLSLASGERSAPRALWTVDFP